MHALKPRNTRFLLIGCLLTLAGMLATPALAQSPAVPSVVAGQPFKVAFDHDGLNVTDYRVVLNGKQVAQVPASARVGGVVTIDMAALPVGSYSLVAVARNAPTTAFVDPVETNSTTYTFEARTKATAPNPPAWRATVLIIAGQAPIIESLVALDSLPETLHLLADGTARVDGR